MRSLRTAGRVAPLCPPVTCCKQRKPAHGEDPAQPKINKNNQGDLHSEAWKSRSNKRRHNWWLKKEKYLYGKSYHKVNRQKFILQNMFSRQNKRSVAKIHKELLQTNFFLKKGSTSANTKVVVSNQISRDYNYKLWVKEEKQWSDSPGKSWKEANTWKDRSDWILYLYKLCVYGLGDKNPPPWGSPQVCI